MKVKGSSMRVPRSLASALVRDLTQVCSACLRAAMSFMRASFASSLLVEGGWAAAWLQPAPELSGSMSAPNRATVFKELRDFVAICIGSFQRRRYVAPPRCPMTTDARNSTLDANQPVAQEGGVLAALVLGNLRAAEAFGFDGKLLREQAGLSDALFADPDGRVPFEHHVLLWESIERDPRAVDLGIWLGSSIGADALGVVG